MINISGGSDKQNAWASQIATDWISELDAEIAGTTARPASDNVQWYADRLLAARTTLIDGLAKITAKQVIDLFVAKRSPVRAIISNARQHKGSQS